MQRVRIVDVQVTWSNGFDATNSITRLRATTKTGLRRAVREFIARIAPTP